MGRDHGLSLLCPGCGFVFLVGLIGGLYLGSCFGLSFLCPVCGLVYCGWFSYWHVVVVSG